MDMDKRACEYRASEGIFRVQQYFSGKSTFMIENLPTIIVEIVKAVPQIIAGIVKAFGSLMYKIVEIGGNIVKGLWSGITQLASWLWDKVSGWISSIWDGICDFFGIHSPSKEMAWVGEMLVKGLAGSIDDNGNEAVKAAEGMAEDIIRRYGQPCPTDMDRRLCLLIMSLRLLTLV